MIRKLFKDISQYFPAKIIPSIVTIITLPILTRLFSPSHYGNYVLVVGIVTILMLLGGWVSLAISRFYPVYEKKGETKEFSGLIIRLAFLTILIIAFLSLVFLFFFRGRIPLNLYPLMIIGVPVYMVTSFFVILLNFLRIKRQIKRYSRFFIWMRLTTPVFGVLLVVIFHLGLKGMLFGAILSIALTLPFLWKAAVGEMRITESIISFKPAVEMIKYSFPLVLGSLAAWILSLSDRYILGIFRNTQEVGIYSISYIIAQNSILFITSLFAMAFNPLSVIIWERQGEEMSKEFVAKSTRYFLILCVPAAVGVSVLREPLLQMLSTPNYFAGAKVIPLVVLGVFFFGLTQRFGAGLSLYKKTNFYMYSFILASLLNLGLNFLFIPKYGYMAAAITTLISYAFLLLLTVVFSRQFFIWEFSFKSLAKISCAAAIMGIGIYFTGCMLTLSALPGLILMVPLGITIYLLMLFLLREIRPDEIQALQALKQYVLKR
ncbi:MAG: polysaccharide biosynthesis C-terminal domain-containing protein [Candidatus Ratteibacteria bacterium]|nr:polysaccharide biosynthesis C-terminal domain-containing protein [Candidatus Ratteibacteria bacterium]